jgi:hypothetical protein
VAGGNLLGPVAQGGDGRLVDEAFQMRAREAEGIGGHGLQIGVGGQRLVAGMELEDLQAAGLVGQVDLYLAVERPGRRRAGSSISARLVAAISSTRTSSSVARPSIWTSISLRVWSYSRWPASGAFAAQHLDLVDEHDRRRLPCLRARARAA